MQGSRKEQIARQRRVHRRKQQNKTIALLILSILFIAIIVFGYLITHNLNYAPRIVYVPHFIHKY